MATDEMLAKLSNLRGKRNATMEEQIESLYASNDEGPQIHYAEPVLPGCYFPEENKQQHESCVVCDKMKVCYFKFETGEPDTYLRCNRGNYGSDGGWDMQCTSIDSIPFDQIREENDTAEELISLRKQLMNDIDMRDDDMFGEHLNQHDWRNIANNIDDDSESKFFEGLEGGQVVKSKQSVIDHINRIVGGSY